METKSVIIDTREPKIIYEIATKRLKDFKVESKKLELGDVVYNNVCIERKSIDDFISSIRKSTFWSNIWLMKNNYKSPLLYLEGDMYEYLHSITQRKGSLQSVEGSLATLALMGIPILHFAKPDSAFKYFNFLFKRASSTKSPQTTQLGFSKSKVKIHELRVQAIMCVPRIGNQTAERLLKEEGSVIKVIEKSKERIHPYQKNIYELYFEEDKDDEKS